MDKLKKEWVEVWSVKDIIDDAVSLGMEYMATNKTAEVLKHNKKILIKELNKRIKKRK